jgi:hypothetical protein
LIGVLAKDLKKWGLKKRGTFTGAPGSGYIIALIFFKLHAVGVL